jgi:hypothetical protein
LHNFKLVACDTDGIAIKKADEKLWSDEERAEILGALNSRMDELIRWEDDGVLRRQIVVKTKNYIMQDPLGKITIKGSGLKASMKEKALQRFIKELVDLLLKDRKDQVLFLYLRYVKEILNLKDITDWCKKVTVTKAVLNPDRTNEQRVADAIKNASVNEGDKVYLFNVTPTELCVREDFKGVYCVDTLLGKLYDTLSIFETVIDISIVPNFTLKRNKKLLDDLGYSPIKTPSTMGPALVKALLSKPEPTIKLITR